MRNVFILLIFVLFAACSSDKRGNSLFTVLPADSTGLNFQNQLVPKPEFNLFSYIYYYNGAGTGAGDFNKDGKIDLFFAANQSAPALYLNRGDMHFEDVTQKTGINYDGAWYTGVSIIDINNDGLLDIYLCAVGNYKVLKGKNKLFICTNIDSSGIPHFEEKSASYGLDFSGFSTQAAFLDYDGDGDLDMFLLNHSVNHDGNYAPRSKFIGTYDSLAGQRLYRNDGNRFTNVTASAGINGSKIGYGLGVSVADINMDGWPDIYVGNDFHENDYLYINQKNGSFLEQGATQLTHTSEFSMGVDVADINNDAFPEIISVDMLPYQPYMLKRSLSEDDYNLFYQKIAYGYTYQHARNNLQYNLRNGSFAEIGQYAGVFATDWSWSPLWIDFNNDGYKDLFVSNGIPKRMNDIDYINFVSGDEIQQKLRTNTIADKDLSLTNKFPEIKLPNQFFVNDGNLHFTNYSDSIQNNPITFSNGALYADLDNDGDLDIITNNINDKVLLYVNNANRNINKNQFATIQVTGPANNKNALGTKLLVYAGTSRFYYEKYPVHGFLSSSEIPITIGLGNNKVDSAILIWPDNSYQKIDLKINGVNSFNYTNGLPAFNYTNLDSKSPVFNFRDITTESGINYTHQENSFNEFDRELLMPRMVSTEGPAIAVADINNDGLEDFYIGASKTYKGKIFTQQPNGKFKQLSEPALELDSMWEAVDAIWVDVNNDKAPDLVIATGGNEYYGQDEHLQPLLYLNDGKGKLTKSTNAFPPIFTTQSKVLSSDFNNDGWADLLITGRAVPWNYGEVPHSFLLLNKGDGSFKDVTSQWSKELAVAGMVTDAFLIDLNNDQKKDIVICSEWGTIDAYLLQKNSFVKENLCTKTGMWQFLLPVDADGDGDVDIIAGNYGLNSRLKATEQEPINMYVNDFDDNGMKEQILTYFVHDEEIPFSSKMQLERRMPVLKKKFLYAAEFAKAKLLDIFPQQKWTSAKKYSITTTASCVLINNGKKGFEAMELPISAQWSTIRSGVMIPGSADNKVLLGGNFYGYNVELGRQDSNMGILLSSNKNGYNQNSIPVNGFPKGEVRRLQKIVVAGKPCLLAVRNNSSLVLLKQQE